MRYKSRNTLYSGTCSRIVQHNAKRFLMLGTYLEFVSPPSSSSLCPSCYNYAVRHSQIIHTLYHIRATGKAIHTISISCTVPVYIPFLFFIPSRVSLSLSLSLSHTHTHTCTPSLIISLTEHRVACHVTTRYLPLNNRDRFQTRYRYTPKPSPGILKGKLIRLLGVQMFKKEKDRGKKSTNRTTC